MLVPDGIVVQYVDEERPEEPPSPPPMVDGTVVVGMTVIVAPDGRAKIVC